MGRKFYPGNPKDFNNPVIVENFVKVLIEKSTNVRWAMRMECLRFVRTISRNWWKKTEEFTLDVVADKITCPALVCEASADHFFAGQPKMLFDALTCEKTFMLFTEEDSAEEHCQFGHCGFLTRRYSIGLMRYWIKIIFHWQRLIDNMK